MELEDFAYDLPKALIAQFPPARRGASRLLILDRSRGTVTHARFAQLGTSLREGDCLVLNDTKVLPVRLVGRKQETGGRVTMVLLRRLAEATCAVLAHTAGPLRVGMQLRFEGSRQSAEIVEANGFPGERRLAIRFHSGEDLDALIEDVGEMPLPPYVKREPTRLDRRRYQTVFARHAGAVAAPTAGLHFTRGHLRQLERRGIRLVYLTLHVGYPTFQPVRAQAIEQHRMDPESCRLSPEAAEILNGAKRGGGRIVACGTTTCRVLETAARRVRGRPAVQAFDGETNLFIFPPYRFRFVDALLTNFHLPRTTLLMLVCAFAGRDVVLRAYHEAIERQYRFYSYGDAMLIV